jgi:hypothetical protein
MIKCRQEYDALAKNLISHCGRPIPLSHSRTGLLPILKTKQKLETIHSHYLNPSPNNNTTQCCKNSIKDDDRGTQLPTAFYWFCKPLNLQPTARWGRNTQIQHHKGESSEELNTTPHHWLATTTTMTTMLVETKLIHQRKHSGKQRRETPEPKNTWSTAFTTTEKGNKVGRRFG